MKMLPLPSLICFCYLLLIFAQVNYYSLSTTSTLLLSTHITAYTEASLIASSLGKGLTTTDYNTLFSSKLQGLCPCPCISLPLLWLTGPLCPRISLTWWCRPLLKLSPLSPQVIFFSRTTCTVFGWIQSIFPQLICLQLISIFPYPSIHIGRQRSGRDFSDSRV